MSDKRRRRREVALAAHVLGRLSAHFDVHEQVSGTVCGQRVRLDAVLTPRDVAPWARSDIALGVEFKDAASLAGDARNMTGWMAQCIDYSYTLWDGWGRLPVFACPALSLGGRPVGHFNEIAHLLGQFNIGELDDTDRFGLTFFMQGHHRLWSEHGGVREAKRWQLRPRTGAR